MGPRGTVAPGEPLARPEEFHPLLLEGYAAKLAPSAFRRSPNLRRGISLAIESVACLRRGKRLGGTELYATQKLAGLFQRMRQPTLATRTSTVTSLLFLFAILAVAMASLHSFRTQLTNVMIAEQNTLVERIADNL